MEPHSSSGAAGLDDDDDGEVYIPIKQRRAMKLQAQQAAGLQLRDAREKRPRGLTADTNEETSKPKKQSLLDQRAEMLASGSMVPLSKEEESKQEESQILSSIDHNFKPLMSVKELAKGVTYNESMKTGWRPPRHIREMGDDERQQVRDKWHILCEGDDLPPPIKSFKDMRFPEPIIAHLKS